MTAFPPGVPVAAITACLSGALGNDLVGLSLYGSAVSGGFDPGVSDLDLVAVTARDAADLDLEALDRAHRSFLSMHSDWRDRLEVVYIGAETLRAFRTSSAPLAVTSPGEPLHLSGPVRDWLQNWYLVRERGVTLAGRPFSDIVPPVCLDEFLSGVQRYVAWLAGPDLDGRSRGSLAYAALSVCRALRTVQTRQLGSKQDGAASVARREPQYAGLIESALACRLAGGRAGFDDPATRAAAIAFVRDLAARVARANA